MNSSNLTKYSFSLIKYTSIYFLIYSYPLNSSFNTFELSEILLLNSDITVDLLTGSSSFFLGWNKAKNPLGVVSFSSDTLSHSWLISSTEFWDAFP